MQKNKITTGKLVQLAFFSAIIILLSLTPLGYIPINPALRPVTVHIPVIIGAIMLGPTYGGILGFVFGLTSLLINTFQPTAVSFVFSPFYSVGGYGGNFWSLIICFVPRILIGVFAGLIYRAIAKSDKWQFTASLISGIIGSMTNTILVMGGIFLFFGQGYAAAKNIAIDALFGVLAAVVGTNGVPEAIVAAIITAAVVKPLKLIQKRKGI